MLRLGQSTARITRGAAAFPRNEALLFPSSRQQQHGASMQWAVRGSKCSSHQTVNFTGRVLGSNHSIIESSDTYAGGRSFHAVSVARFASPHRFMSTAAGANSNPPNATGVTAAAGDVGTEALTGASDVVVTAATTADQAQAAVEVAPEALNLALYTPPNLAIMAVDGLHATTGMPYWMAIVAITVGIRAAILPLGLVAARNGARTAAMKPEMDALQAAIKNDQQSSQPRKVERYRQEMRALYKKYGASLMMNAALPVVQLPVFIGFFLGLRRMPEAVPELATGGALWFPDLGAPDPYFAFPIMTGVMMLAMAELGGEAGSMAMSSAKMKAAMRGMAFLVVPFTMNISTGVFLYWTTSNTFSVLQILLFKSPSIKKYFNFPSPTSAPKMSASAAQKELSWFDVLGGDNPVKEYRKMQEQREAQAWYIEGDGRVGPMTAGGRGGGSVEREGAPFQPPPSIAGPVGEEASGSAVGAKGKSGLPRPKPRVVLHDTRPRSVGKSSDSPQKVSPQRPPPRKNRR